MGQVIVAEFQDVLRILEKERRVPVELICINDYTSETHQAYVREVYGEIGDLSINLTGEVGFTSGTHQAFVKRLVGKIGVRDEVFIDIFNSFTSRTHQAYVDKITGRVGELYLTLDGSPDYTPYTHQAFASKYSGILKK